jgi:hypothetical protein
MIASMTDFEETLVRMLPSVLGFLGGFLTAIFAEPLRQWMYRPKLVLEFGQSADFVTKTPERSDDAQYEAYYVRVKVTNKRSRLAKGCRAYLVGIERLTETGRFERTEYCDSIQLGWAVRGDQSYSAIDLPKDVPHFIDVVSTRPVSNSFKPHIHPVPMRYQQLFATQGTYRLTIRVSGDGVEPASSSLWFKWSGK